MDKEIRYQRDLSHNYLIMGTDDTEKEDYRFRMLENQKTKGLLSCSVRRINGKRFLYYQIDGYKSIKDRFSCRGMNAAQLHGLFREMEETCREMSQYLLDEDSIVLSVDMVFASLKDGSYAFLCYPGEAAQESKEEFALGLTEIIDHEDDAAVNAAYEFCEKIQEGGYNLSELAAYMQSRMNGSEKGQEQMQNMQPSHISLMQQPHVSPAQQQGYPQQVFEAQGPSVTMEELYDDMEEEEEAASMGKEKTKSSTFYIYAVCAFLICMAGYYIRQNYVLDQRENIISLAMLVLTAILSLVFLVCGLRSKKSASEEDRTNAGKKEKLEKRTSRPAKEAPEKKKATAVRTAGMAQVLAAPVQKEEAYSQMLASNLQMFASPQQPVQRTAASDTTILQTPNSQRVSRLYSRGLNNCIQISLQNLPMTIGKMEGCVDYELPNSTISRIHARLTKDENGQIFLADLGSTNGTYHNGERLRPQIPTPIVPGDEIGFAELIFDYR